MLALVQETESAERNEIDTAELKGLIREGITDQHELFARHIDLNPPRHVAEITSGKIQRALA